MTKQDKFFPGGLADNFTGFAERELLRLAQVKVQIADNASVELNVSVYLSSSQLCAVEIKVFLNACGGSSLVPMVSDWCLHPKCWCGV